MRSSALCAREVGGGPPAAIVLLSDGKTTAGRDPVELPRGPRLRGPDLHRRARHVRRRDRAPRGLLPVPPDLETLHEIAQQSGGRAFTADDADGLRASTGELGSQLGTKKEKREITAGFAAGGAAARRRRPGRARRPVRLP